jgi:2-dehydropantoate 2-reductase
MSACHQNGNMKITIIGLGAMGSLFAGRLSHLANITLFGHWQEQLAVLKEQGLTLIHPDGRQSQHPVQATNDPDKLATADLILVLVKSPYTAAAASTAAQALKSDGLALTLQNGLGNLEMIAGRVGANRAAQGITSEGAAVPRPGIVRHAGPGQTYLASGQVDGRPAGQKRLGQLQEVTALFNQAGFETELVQSAGSLLWGKLAVNAGINPLTALLQVTNGFLVENEDARWLMSQAAAEVAAVAQALGIALPYPDAAGRALQVAQATAANFSSMAQDIARGSLTEIDAICGVVVQEGRRLGIPTPINQTLYDLVRRQTAGENWQAALDQLPAGIRQRLVRLAF